MELRSGWLPLLDDRGGNNPNKVVSPRFRGHRMSSSHGDDLCGVPSQAFRPWKRGDALARVSPMSPSPPAPALTKDQLQKAKARPPIPPTLFSAIPQELRTHKSWVVWGWKRVGRWTKVPKKVVVLQSGKHGRTIKLRDGKSNDSRTWTTWENAVAAVEHFADTIRPQGLGFVLSQDDPFFCVDIDDCRNRDTGELTAEAREIIATFDTYTEVSPSGTGVKLYGRGKKIIARVRKAGCHVEVFDDKRFLALTGSRLEGSPTELRDCQKELDALLRDMFPEEAEPKKKAAPRKPRDILPEPGDGYDWTAQEVMARASTDDELVFRAMNGRAGDRFRRLWAGEDLHGDKSVSDYELACHLARVTDFDAPRVEAMMWQSGMVRDKWRQQRAVPYVADTARRACESALAEQEAKRSRGGQLAAGARDAMVQIEEGDEMRPLHDFLRRMREQAEADRANLADAMAASPEIAAEVIRHSCGDRGRFRCTDMRRIALFDRQEGKGRLQEVRCCSSSCEGCLGWLIHRETVNAIVRFNQASQAGRLLYECGCNVNQWPALQRRLNRAGANYFRVNDGEGYWIVADQYIAGMIVVNRNVAIGCLDTLLRDWCGRRPISSSHGWCLPKQVESNRFERIGMLAATVDVAEIDQVCTQHGATAVLSCPQRQTGRTMRAWVLEGVEWDAARDLLEELCTRMTREERAEFRTLRIMAPPRNITEAIGFYDDPEDSATL